jgi:hypothetical protein
LVSFIPHDQIPNPPRSSDGKSFEVSTLICLKTKQEDIGYTSNVPFEFDDLLSPLKVSGVPVLLVGSTLGFVEKSREEITLPSCCLEDIP